MKGSAGPSISAKKKALTANMTSIAHDTMGSPRWDRNLTATATA